MEFKEAVRIVINKIKSDKGLRLSYKANIAVAFIDEYHRNTKEYKNAEDIHDIANKAADRFLDSWCKDD